MTHAREIIATGISNLTDARYFSAMGAHWMGFDLRTEPRLSIEQMQAMMDWVEGPQWLVEIDHQNETGIPPDIQYVIADPFDMTQGNNRANILRITLRDLQVHQATQSPVLIDCMQAVPTAEHHAMITGLAEQRKVWMRAPWSPGLLSRVVQEFPSVGIVMSGGAELAVGVKDYDLYDDLFKVLGA